MQKDIISLKQDPTKGREQQGHNWTYKGQKKKPTMEKNKTRKCPRRIVRMHVKHITQKKVSRFQKNQIQKTICCKIFFIFKFINPITQETKSWARKEQVGLSIGQHASDEVTFAPVIIDFFSFDSKMKVERKLYSSFEPLLKSIHFVVNYKFLFVFH
jgi:hypothetical protein